MNRDCRGLCLQQPPPPTTTTTTDKESNQQRQNNPMVATQSYQLDRCGFCSLSQSQQSQQLVNNFSNQNSSTSGTDNSSSSLQDTMDFASKSRNGSISSTSVQQQQQQPTTAGTPVSSSTGYQRAPMLAMIHSSQSSSLTNEQLTAHLTEEERQILQKVWQKEEEFKEIALKK